MKKQYINPATEIIRLEGPVVLVSGSLDQTGTPTGPAQAPDGLFDGGDEPALTPFGL